MKDTLQHWYNAIMVGILILCGVVSPFALVYYLRMPDSDDPTAPTSIFVFGCFVIMDIVAIIWYIRNKVKAHQEKRRLSEKYHSRDERAREIARSGNAKFMKICPRCLWIPHSKCDWVEHKGTEQATCYYCHIPLEATNCTEEEFNRSDDLKGLVFEYFASQKDFDKETYEKRVRNDLAHKKQTLERHRREEQQNQQSQPSQPSQPNKLYQPSPQHQPSPVTQQQTPAQPPLPTLATCPVCGGKVSTAATACPHCGQPLSGGRIASR